MVSVCDGEYFVQAMGARGSTVSGNRGLGALVGGKVYLQKDDNISIVVGQVGTSTAGPGGGGGGGSFFCCQWRAVIVAGGGGPWGAKDSLGRKLMKFFKWRDCKYKLSRWYQWMVDPSRPEAVDNSDGGEGSQATGGRMMELSGYKTAGTYGGDGGFGGGGGERQRWKSGSLHDGGGGYSGGGGGLEFECGSDTFLISGYNDDNGLVTYLERTRRNRHF